MTQIVMGKQYDMNVDIGQGVDQGIRYESSDPTIVAVDSVTGVLEALVDPEAPVQVYIRVYVGVRKVLTRKVTVMPSRGDPITIVSNEIVELPPVEPPPEEPRE